MTRLVEVTGTIAPEDPALKEAIDEALEGATSVVNVGAGTGSYEPTDAVVYPIEPSEVMASQRPNDRPTIRANADALPFHDRSVDAAMTVLSLHHWHPNQEAGVREMCRVARDTVTIVTIDPAVSGAMWLLADYMPEVRDRDFRIFPSPTTIAGWLDRPSIVTPVLVHRDTPDHTLISFWAHPDRVLDPRARAATSGFALQPGDIVARVVHELDRDLRSGAWDARYGHLRDLDQYDAGLRLIRASHTS